MGRKGLQYLETLTNTEKEMCNMLEGLFETLTNKFKPQYNETIKSLQFRTQYRYDDENVQEWMGRLQVAAVECNYQEADRQLKEQFIHGLNDKCMLEEIIKELTDTKNDDHIMSGGVLVWGQKSRGTEDPSSSIKYINGIQAIWQHKSVQKIKENKARTPVHLSAPWQPCKYWGDPPAKAMPSIWQGVHGMQ